MTEQEPWPEPNKTYVGITRGDVEYDILYKIPASEDYPHGDHVGFIQGPNGWKFAVSFEGETISNGHYGFSPVEKGPFPAKTKWCIASNTAIEYGIDAEETPSYRQ